MGDYNKVITDKSEFKIKNDLLNKTLKIMFLNDYRVITGRLKIKELSQIA